MLSLTQREVRFRHLSAIFSFSGSLPLVWRLLSCFHGVWGHPEKALRSTPSILCRNDGQHSIELELENFLHFGITSSPLTVDNHNEGNLNDNYKWILEQRGTETSRTVHHDRNACYEGGEQSKTSSASGLSKYLNQYDKFRPTSS